MSDRLNEFLHRMLVIDPSQNPSHLADLAERFPQYTEQVLREAYRDLLEAAFLGLLEDTSDEGFHRTFVMMCDTLSNK